MLRITKSMMMIVAFLTLVAGCGKESPKPSRTSTPLPEAPQQSKALQDNLKATAETAADRVSKEVTNVAQAALAFTLKDQAGKEVRLSDYTDKIVVLEWLNPECPFVEAHLKVGTMATLAKQYAEKGVVWLGVNSTNTATAEKNKSVVDQHSLPYPVLDDHAGVAGRLFGAKTTPHMFVLDSKGRIAYQGAIDNAPLGKVAEGQEPVNYVDQALSELLKGVTVSVPSTDPYGCSVKY